VGHSLIPSRRLDSGRTQLSSPCRPPPSRDPSARGNARATRAHSPEPGRSTRARLALLAVGLDPGLGWMHRDAPYRESAALDLLEPLRPAVDDYVMRLLETRTFSRREFAELPTGQVRLMPDLARSLAATLPTWERMASVQAETIAKLLAKSARGAVRIPGAATRGASGKGRGTMGRGATRGTRRPRLVANACRECGLILEDPVDPRVRGVPRRPRICMV